MVFTPSARGGKITDDAMSAEPGQNRDFLTALHDLLVRMGLEPPRASHRLPLGRHQIVRLRVRGYRNIDDS